MGFSTNMLALRLAEILDIFLGHLSDPSEASDEAGRISDETKKELESLKRELQSYLYRGAIVTYRGEACTLRDIAAMTAVAETGCYMKEFVWDPSGKVHQINFEYVRTDC